MSRQVVRLERISDYTYVCMYVRTYCMYVVVSDYRGFTVYVRTCVCTYISIFLFCCHCVLVSDGVLEHVVVYSCVVFPTWM